MVEDNCERRYEPPKVIELGELCAQAFENKPLGTCVSPGQTPGNPASCVSPGNGQ